LSVGNFPGKIDDIRFYDRSLSNQEVQAIYLHANGYTLADDLKKVALGNTLEE
jgi:hypothetical protein